jgi:predicted regulator of Ras-like GTPase activity (Roadblock/LC7/MglB family)
MNGLQPMELKETQQETPSSFEGAVAGLTLPDIIQMNALNRFSGCISVQFGQLSGVIFFRDGEIIHAAQEDLVGEAAFYEILQWPGGKFNLQPKVTTTSITIRESWKFLLMEACRLQDENRNRPQNFNQPLEKKTGAAKEDNGMSSNISTTLAQISGVTHAVLLSKDGIPVNDDSFIAGNLAAQAVNMSMIGNQLGDLFGAGTVKRAAIQGKVSHLLVFEAKNHFLSIAVSGENQLGVVEAEVRKVLIAQK